MDFLEFVLSDFGITPATRTKSGMLIQLNRWLIERFRQQETCVIVVDEAQNLSSELLEEIRLLTNLETSSEKLVQIILSGQAGVRRQASPAGASPTPSACFAVVPHQGYQRGTDGRLRQLQRLLIAGNLRANLHAGGSLGDSPRRPLVFRLHYRSSICEHALDPWGM